MNSITYIVPSRNAKSRIPAFEQTQALKAIHHTKGHRLPAHCLCKSNPNLYSNLAGVNITVVIDGEALSTARLATESVPQKGCKGEGVLLFGT